MNVADEEDEEEEAVAPPKTEPCRHLRREAEPLLAVYLYFIHSHKNWPHGSCVSYDAWVMQYLKCETYLATVRPKCTGLMSTRESFFLPRLHSSQQKKQSWFHEEEDEVEWRSAAKVQRNVRASLSIKPDPHHLYFLSEEDVKSHQITNKNATTTIPRKDCSRPCRIMTLTLATIWHETDGATNSPRSSYNSCIRGGTLSLHNKMDPYPVLCDDQQCLNYVTFARYWGIVGTLLSQ